MPTNDTADWEGIARREIHRETEDRARRLRAKAHTLANAFESDDVTHDDVRGFRNAVEELVVYTEDNIVARTPAFEPYNRYAGLLGTTKDIASILDLTTAQVNEANNGATVELDSETVHELADGHSVEIETPAGIDVELVPESPDLGETNSGP